MTEEQRALLEVVASFAEGELAPRAAADDATATFPRVAFEQMAAMGLTGLPLPHEVGGAGQAYGFYLRVLERLARCHVVVALTLSVHTLASTVIAAGGRGPVRREVLSALNRGEGLAAYCLSEPHSGSDAAALSTRAVRDGDDYVLSGTKAWVTHAGHADWYVVMARSVGADGEPIPGHRGITAFLVPASAEGLEPGRPEHKMGLNASPTAVVHLDGVRVPADHRLGEEGEGFSLALGALDGGRLAIAAIAVGLAQAALDASAAHAGEREQFGQAIGRFQGVGFMLADMATNVEAARALTWQAAARRDRGEQTATRLASMAKLLATDTAMAAATDAIQVHGGSGYATEAGVERLFREAKVMQIFEGTNQVQRHVIARDLVG